MKEKPSIIIYLTKEENKKRINELYSDYKKYLHKEFQKIDDKVIVSYFIAYIISVYEKQENTFAKNHFIVTLKAESILTELLNEFINRLNATKSNLGDLVHKETHEELDKLKTSKKNVIYKELSKSNKDIAKIIKDYHGYFTVNELKKKSQEEPPSGIFKPYIVSLDEISTIEATKEWPTLNELGHLLYDVKRGYRYCCDHDIKDDSEELKRIMVNTGRNNPKFDILFKDGTIVEYYRGDIRIKSYTFGHVIKLTKLYYAQHYEELKKYYEQTMYISNANNSNISYQLGRNMLINSYTQVLDILESHEEIYTRKMLDDYNKEFVKIKEIVKKYDL